MTSLDRREGEREREMERERERERRAGSDLVGDVEAAGGVDLVGVEVDPELP